MSEQLKGHGHVTPNADGFLARCGGPSICKVCKEELAALKAQSLVMPEQDGSDAQIAFWAGFEFAVCGLHNGNIRAAWNDFKSSEQFKRLNAAPAQQVRVADGWRIVPITSLERICRYIDPAPVRMPNGDTMVFKNPHAAAALREISAEFRAMIAAAPAEPDSQKVDVNMVLPCDIKLPGGMMIGKGCKLSTLLLSFRNRGDDAAWRQRFSVPVPYDPVLLSIRQALAKAKPGADQ